MSLPAQERTLNEVVNELKTKILNSEKGERLKWMDSLTLVIEFNEEFGYNAVIRENIKYALALDSLGTATRHTADLIYYKSSILGKVNEGLALFKEFESKAKRAKNYRPVANLYLYAGDCYYALRNLDDALVHYTMARDYAIKAEDENRIGVSTLRMSYVYGERGQFADASQSIQEASRVFRAVGDTINWVNAKNSLSILYSQNAFYEEADKERKEAILLCNNIGGGPLVSLYYNAGADSRMQGKNSEWIRYLQMAYAENEKSEYRLSMRPNILNNLVIAYAVSDSVSKASVYFKEVESDLENYAGGNNRDYYIEASKQLAEAKGNYPEALKYGKEHLNLKRSQDGFVEIYNAEKFLADVYSAMGNTNNANLHLNAYYKIKDSISSVQNVRTLSYYQTLYETEKRDLKISAQESDISLLAARNKVKNQFLLFGGLGLVGLFGFILLIRSRNFARKKQKLQEDFSQGLIQAQEEERTRVARELHDSVGQKLMLLTKKTKAVGNAEMESLAGNTLEELRSISRGLHPATLERLGVTAAIKSMINEVDANTNIFFTNEIEDIDKDLSKEASLHVFRIIQEVLNNMVKHSNAKVASVIIEKKGQTIQTIIRDNGKGFQFSDKLGKGSLGMKTLMERAKILHSKLNIRSEVNSGTTIELIIPT